MLEIIAFIGAVTGSGAGTILVLSICSSDRRGLRQRIQDWLGA